MGVEASLKKYVVMTIIAKYKNAAIKEISANTSVVYWKPFTSQIAPPRGGPTIAPNAKPQLIRAAVLSLI